MGFVIAMAVATGVKQVAANPAQYQQQHQQVAAQTSAVRVPGMPDTASDDAEGKWMRLFNNPQSWYDNRQTVRCSLFIQVAVICCAHVHVLF
jgi:hypothetical protein